MSRTLAIWLAMLALLTALPVTWLATRQIDPTASLSWAVLVIAYSPTLAALVAVVATGGGAGLCAWGRRLLRFRVAPGWYVLVFLGPMCVVMAAHVVDLVGSRPPASQWFDLGGPAAAAGSLVAGSIGEEPGWRGLAHPELRREHSLAVAGLVVGIIWASWHNWTAFFPASHSTVPDVLFGCLRLIATAIIYGWLYDATRGSVPVVMVAHLGHNLAVALLPSTTGHSVALIAAGYVLIAIAVLICRRPRIRPQLGIDRAGSPDHVESAE